jgi:hypothetical protein
MRRVILLAAVGCAVASGADPLRLEPRVLERKSPGCSDQKSPCGYARIEWVEVVSGPREVRDRMNRAILDAVATGPPGKANPEGPRRATPAEIAQDFVQEYLKDRHGTTSQLGWSLDGGAQVLRNRAPVLSLEFSSESYAGGAHGSASTWYLNLDFATGKRLALSDVLVEGALPRLTQIAERHFRKERELAPDADLKAEGFWWEDGRFHLNQNFALGEKSLIFFYNQYEITSYAAGPTEIEIPFEEIGELLKVEFRGPSAP